MDLNFGINGSFAVEAARPITISSSTPIGVIQAVTTPPVNVLQSFNNATDALAYIATLAPNDGGVAFDGIELQGVNCPVVVSFCLPTKADVLTAIEQFKQSDAVTGINLKNGIIIAPTWSNDIEVAAKLDAVASALWATGIADIGDKTEAESVAYAANFGSKYMLLGGGVYRADGKNIPFSALMAGVIAYYDSESSFGWAKNHSNRIAKGVFKHNRVDANNKAKPYEYIDSSDCEAKRLRQHGIATIVKDVGWRTYGFETTDIDPIWQSLDRVRTFHKLLDAIIKANKWARDREADQLIWVKKTVVEFMNELKGNNVVIGFDVYFDPTKNTAATVTAGKFYLTIKVQDMPSIRELNIELVYSDAYGATLINYLNS